MKSWKNGRVVTREEHAATPGTTSGPTPVVHGFDLALAGDKGDLVLLTLDLGGEKRDFVLPGAITDKLGPALLRVLGLAGATTEQLRALVNLRSPLVTLERKSS